jgi:prolipoprotein diacylglyceryltransferase
MYILKEFSKLKNSVTEAHEALFMYGIIRIFVGARLGHCFFYDFDWLFASIERLFFTYSKNLNGIYPS